MMMEGCTRTSPMSKEIRIRRDHWAALQKGSASVTRVSEE